ncbi:MAG: DUF3172 domain-containing protein [Spirulinaceae cyanobacterium]
MRRRPPYSPPRDYRDREPTPTRNSSPALPFGLSYAAMAIIGGIFILGIGIGIFFSTATSFGVENITSSETIDRSAPNAELCVQYGASAIVTDTKVFVTLNPFHVYVTQPIVQPGCVLRRNNWSILEQKKLVTTNQVRDCKQRLNTFGFIGSLDSKPEIDCIYQNEAGDNLFANPSGTVGPPPKTNDF